MNNINSNGYPHRGYDGFDGAVDEFASKSRPSWERKNEASQGSPNVVVVLMDDMGFSDIGSFGSEIETPSIDSIAAAGYRCTNYQTAAVCSPARASLMTGLNPHRAGFWSVAHSDPGYPGATLEIGETTPTLAENFRAAGYATFMLGKWHLTKESNLHDAASRSSWPVQRGFDQYYGSMDGFTSLHHPHRLIRDNQSLCIDEYPEGYFLTDDLTDEALRMVKGLRSHNPDKPFFLYFAHQAVHGPLQAKAEDIEKYRGRYDEGWDELRAQRFTRQIEERLFSQSTVCAPRNVEKGFNVQPWSDLEPEDRQLYAKYMEVYAAAVDNADQNLGRLVRLLKDMGEYENTIFVFTSDNGATGEGGPIGTRSYFSHFAQNTDLPADWIRDVPRDPELIGGPRTSVHYPRGWAYASNTPFRLYKAHAFAGGTRVPFVLSWPAGLARGQDDDGVRDQYAYVTDVGETLMDLAGVKGLSERNGHPAPERDGVSFAEWLRTPGLPSTHSAQYTEHNGRRAFIRQEWKAVTGRAFGPGWEEDRWQLFNVRDDPAETTDVSGAFPELTRELAEEWREAAWNNTVFPMNDDGSMTRMRPSTEAIFEEPVTLFPGTPTLERFRSSKLTKLRSFNVEIRGRHNAGDAGTLVAHGDQGGGYSVYVLGGELHFSYNEYGTMHRIALPMSNAGSWLIRLRFEALPDVKWRIMIEAPEGFAELPAVLQLSGMAPFTGISVGADRGGPVDWSIYEQHKSFPFTGEIASVRYLPGPKADYNKELLVDINRAVELMYE